MGTLSAVRVGNVRAARKRGEEFLRLGHFGSSTMGVREAKAAYGLADLGRSSAGQHKRGEHAAPMEENWSSSRVEWESGWF